MQEISWRKIVGDYGVLLKEQIVQRTFIPESLLPFSRDQIKKAILAGLSELGPEQKDLKENLKSAFVYLANFIPEDEATEIERVEVLLKQVPVMAALEGQDQEKVKEELTRRAASLEAYKRIFERTKQLAEDYQQELDEAEGAQ